MSKHWIDFSKLRKELSFEKVLHEYDVHLTKKGSEDQFVGPCPLPKHGEKRGPTFSANFAKGVFQCFGCKQGGNVLDFAVLMEGFEKDDGKGVRKVAVKLQKLVSKQEVGVSPPERTSKAHRPIVESQKKPRIVVNAPLDFTLKTLESDHFFFEEHDLSAATIDRFGLGFCKRGALSGRIAVPLHNDNEELVGYCGLTVDESLVSETYPKYLFPPQREVGGVIHTCDPTLFLYNGCRIGQAVRDLIIVQECHTVWALSQGGFGNVVALMGNGCSEDQAELVNLLTVPNSRIWLLTDKTTESKECAASTLLKLAPSRLCRWMQFERQSEIGPDHPLLELLSKR